MPIVVKDYTWKETEAEVLITLPLKGVKSSKADIFSTDQYIKVNFPPYLFEAHLYAPVEEEQCSVKVGNGIVEFRLIKRDPKIWGSLVSAESEDKKFMVEKRAEAVEHAHKSAAEEAERKAKKKREEEQYAIKQQIRLDDEDRERIEREKQEERDRAERELERWKEEKRKKAVEATPKTQPMRTKPTPMTAAKKSSPGDIWKKDKSKEKAVPPPPRKAGSIEVTFTPRVFPTAARESKEAEEQEYLAKMAAARRIKPPVSEDETINERNPEFLKDKGVEFFKAGNHEAALNAFSEGIQLNPNLPHLFSNRAACYLAMGENERCISDCCRALELFFPVAPSNYRSRTKVFVRRGTAYASVGSLDLAVQDYEAALKLTPDDEKLKADCVRLKEALTSSPD